MASPPPADQDVSSAWLLCATPGELLRLANRVGDLTVAGFLTALARLNPATAGGRRYELAGLIACRLRSPGDPQARL